MINNSRGLNQLQRPSTLPGRGTLLEAADEKIDRFRGEKRLAKGPVMVGIVQSNMVHVNFTLVN